MAKNAIGLSLVAEQYSSTFFKTTLHQAVFWSTKMSLRIPKKLQVRNRSHPEFCGNPEFFENNAHKVLGRADKIKEKTAISFQIQFS